MQNSKMLSVISGAAAGLVVVVTVVGGVAMVNYQTLVEQLDVLREDRHEAWAEVQASYHRQAAAEEALEVQLQRVKVLESEMDALKAKVEGAAQAGKTERRAVRGRIYAGQQSMGDGWILVGGEGTNGPLDTVVLVDERSLKNLVRAAAEDLAAGETPREVTVNHNYGSVPYANTAWWPVTWGGHYPGHPTNRPPAGGISPPASTLPPPTGNTGGRGIWRPTQKPFLPNPSPWPGVTPQRAQPTFQPVPRASSSSVSQPFQAAPVQRGFSRGR